MIYSYAGNKHGKFPLLCSVTLCIALLSCQSHSLWWDYSVMLFHIAWNLRGRFKKTCAMYFLCLYWYHITIFFLFV